MKSKPAQEKKFITKASITVFIIMLLSCFEFLYNPILQKSTSFFLRKTLHLPQESTSNTTSVNPKPDKSGRTYFNNFEALIANKLMYTKESTASFDWNNTMVELLVRDFNKDTGIIWVDVLNTNDNKTFFSVKSTCTPIQTALYKSPNINFVTSNIDIFSYLVGDSQLKESSATLKSRTTIFAYCSDAACTSIGKECVLINQMQ